MTFLGVVNGRPRFDFGPRAPTPAERELASRVQVRDGVAYMDGAPLAPGAVVRG